MPNATPVYLNQMASSSSSSAASSSSTVSMSASSTASSSTASWATAAQAADLQAAGLQGGSVGLSYITELAQLRAENAQLLAENRKLQGAADDALADILAGDAVAKIARQALLNNIRTINLVLITTFGLGIAYRWAVM